MFLLLHALTALALALGMRANILPLNYHPLFMNISKEANSLINPSYPKPSPTAMIERITILRNRFGVVSLFILIETRELQPSSQLNQLPSHFPHSFVFQVYKSCFLRPGMLMIGAAVAVVVCGFNLSTARRLKPSNAVF